MDSGPGLQKSNSPDSTWTFGLLDFGPEVHGEWTPAGGFGLLDFGPESKNPNRECESPPTMDFWTFDLKSRNPKIHGGGGGGGPGPKSRSPKIQIQASSTMDFWTSGLRSPYRGGSPREHMVLRPVKPFMVKAQTVVCVHEDDFVRCCGHLLSVTSSI